MSRLRERALLTSGALAPGMIMLASFTPTPLFPEYQDRWGVGETGVSTMFAAYPLGVVLCLTLLGGLSDVIGRRRAILIGGAVLVMALALLSVAPSPALMVLGRIVQGVGVAIVATAAASALMELHPRGPEAGSQFNTASVSIGVAVGPLLSGLLAEHLPAPFTTPYLVVAGLVLLPVALAAVAPPATRVPGAAVVRPIRVPRTLLRPFVASAAAVGMTNLCTGLMGAFGPEVAQSLGWQGSALSGIFVSVVLTAVAVAQLLGGSWAPRRAMVGGGVAAVTGWILLAVASSASHAPLAVAAATMLGLGAGATLLGSAAAMAGWAPADRRAELYAAWLLVPFTTLGASAFLAAPLLAATSAVTVLVAAGGVTAVATALVHATAVRQTSGAREPLPPPLA